MNQPQTEQAERAKRYDTIVALANVMKEFDIPATLTAAGHGEYKGTIVRIDETKNFECIWMKALDDSKEDQQVFWFQDIRHIELYIRS